MTDAGSFVFGFSVIVSVCVIVLMFYVHLSGCDECESLFEFTESRVISASVHATPVNS